MYSAQGLAATLFAPADLPDAITLLGVGSLSRSGNSYGDFTNGIALETPLWGIYVGGVRTTRDCLIDGDGNLTPGNNADEDQFAATYSIAGTLTGTVTRSSLCDWLATGITLKFNFASQRWNVNGNEKSSGNQSSPVGSYNGGFAVA